MLTILELKQLLQDNEILLKQAMAAAQSERVYELMNHRAIVKDMLLAAFETELAKVA